MVKRRLVKQVVMAVEALKTSRGVKRDALDHYLRQRLGPGAPEECRLAVEQALVEGLLLLKSGRYYPKPTEPAVEPTSSKCIDNRRSARLTMKAKNSRKEVRVRRGQTPAVHRGRPAESPPRTRRVLPKGRLLTSTMSIAEEDARSRNSSPRKKRVTYKRRKSAPNFGTQIWKAWNSFWSPKREYKHKRRGRKANTSSKMSLADDVVYVD